MRFTAAHAPSVAGKLSRRSDVKTTQLPPSPARATSSLQACPALPRHLTRPSKELGEGAAVFLQGRGLFPGIVAAVPPIFRLSTVGGIGVAAVKIKNTCRPTMSTNRLNHMEVHRIFLCTRHRLPRLQLPNLHGV
ncbi:hypothetical protein O3P69_003451 [Scylla paramamosain]|uniref:Uncharacterized protein n=1 Tax=Scylla paramamosain TaxID=85552 RepID=A0AAW0UM85_SCYPA